MDGHSEGGLEIFEDVESLGEMVLCQLNAGPDKGCVH